MAAKCNGHALNGSAKFLYAVKFTAQTNKTFIRQRKPSAIAEKIRIA
jgi:hypothetical protein